MQPERLIPDLPYLALRLALAGGGRAGLRGMMGECLELAVALGRTMRNFVRARQDRRNDGDPTVPADADVGKAASLLTRAFAWAAYLGRRLIIEGGERRRRSGAGAMASVPLSAVTGRGPKGPVETRGPDEVAASAAAAMERRLRRAKANAERAALAARLGGMPIPAILRQICDDLHEAATLLGQTETAKRVETMARRTGQLFAAAFKALRDRAAQIARERAARPGQEAPGAGAAARPLPDTG